MRAVAEAVLGLLPRDVAYGDVRVVRKTHELVLAERSGPGELAHEESIGLGLRVVVGGQWGFSATHRLDDAGIADAVERAVVQARSAAGRGEIPLGEPVTTQDRWETPLEVDPFGVPVSTKLDLLAAVVAEAESAGPLLTRVEASMDFFRDDKIFANTEGALIEQVITESGAGLLVLAGDGNDVQRRSFPNSIPRNIRGQRGEFATAGYEHIAKLGLVENAARVADEAVQLLTAKPCPAEMTTMIATGVQLAMVLHESSGHPMEADRALGWEASLAGGTYATPERRGSFRWGSPICNVYADATIPGALGSFGYDDEGVRAQRVQLVRDGIFLGYMAGRESGGQLDVPSTGSARAESWQRVPLVRMTNLCMEPGDSSLEEMIADTKGGVLLDVNRGFSVDDQRMSFRFTTEIGWEIKNGKRGAPLKNCSYSSITPEFWASCDALGNEDEFSVYGVPSCNKGEPLQVAHVGHGTVPARFRNVQVGTR
ncbi:MAG TPA: TldD/PmbA family protein [Gaiellaceae bacterium]|jgi:TldD protein